MPVTLTSLTDLDALGFDEIIDARTPLEHAEDALPGAVNLPVLDDAERALVGTIYRQVSPFTARKTGAALVARNVAAHLQGPLADRPGEWRPLVYCWRGGQRSGAFATILRGVGWRVETLDGGYKAWRRLVVQALYDRPVTAPVILLDGNTGSAKTEVLNLLPGFGVQVLDLEGLAAHRGSLFGAVGPQPPQRRFEGALAMALARLDPARPVVVEAESSKIGSCRLPPALWKAMVRAPRLVIEAPREARTGYLLRAYADIAADPRRLMAVIEQLRPWQPAARIAEWRAMVAAGDHAALAAGLIDRHYDPRYARHRARVEVPLHRVEAPALDPGALPGLATRIAAMVREGGLRGDGRS
ncbi:MAG: tRNA 2-selenouridine(34) synthase MnmH [Gemmobacter sp.]